MIKKIYLDMDDVLVPFNIPAHAKLEIPHDPWPWDIGEFYLPCYDEEFWQSLDTTFWASRGWMPEGVEIFNFCAALVGYDNLMLCTTFAPFAYGEDVAGKMEWIEEHLPREMWKQLIFTYDKSHFADRNSILIDDFGDHVQKFRLFGGSAVLAPACHNHLHKSSPLKHIRRAVQRIISR